MRNLLLIATLILSGFIAEAANNNPWMRTCRIEQGQFWVLNAQGGVALCFFGDAAIGAETLFKFKTTGIKSQAVKAYLKRSTEASRGGVCGTYGADLIAGTDTNGNSHNVCKFEDGSLIEETTLWLGPDSGTTEGLDKALSTSY